MPADRYQCSQSCEACRTIVSRAYFELLARGYAEEDAYGAADHVLALRHPSYTQEQRVTLISKWLFNDTDH